MTGDPCFSCLLPDCDDGSPRCGLRRLHRSYEAKLRRGRVDEATDAERAAAAARYHDWVLERLALAAEGVRPFKRRGSAWTGEEARP